jgi:4-hydroxybenzoate polyprenyltransferase
MSEPTLNSITRSTWLDYMRLLRLPIVGTALADVAMGFLFVRGTLAPWPVFLLLALTSACLYCAGMVLNDVWDIEEDRRLRPERVLPTGRIEWTVARRLGWALLVSGVLCGWSAGVVGMAPQVEIWHVEIWRCGFIATLLAACVIAYDGWLKRTALGPIAMGSCRLLNVLLGMSVAGPLPSVFTTSWGGFALPHALAAGGMGVYIAGVTWLARTEATLSRRGALAGATCVITTGLVLLASVESALPIGLVPDTMAPRAWYTLMGLLSFVIVRRCLVAVLDPRPQRVQLAVKNCLVSIIILDASLVMLVCGLGWSLVVLSLLIPTLIGGRWISAT